MLLFLIICMATTTARGGSADDPTRPPFLLLRCGTGSSSSSTSARKLRRPCRRLVRQDPTELEATGTYKILYNMYNIFKINVLTIICLNDFTSAPRRRGLSMNRQAAADLVHYEPSVWTVTHYASPRRAYTEVRRSVSSMVCHRMQHHRPVRLPDAVPFLEGCSRRRHGADDSSPSCK